MIHIAIVDDDEKFRLTLTEYITKYFDGDTSGFTIKKFSNGLDFLSEYKCEYDIVILDIQMPMMNGMNVAEELRKVDPDVKLIFITQVANFAIRGYSVAATDYILKPLDYENDFKVKFARVVKAAEKARLPRNLVFTDDNGTVVRIVFDEWLYAVKDRDYAVFVTTRGEYRRRMNMSAVAKMLDGFPVAAVNSGCMVNLDFVKNIDGNVAVLSNEDTLVISRGKKKDFFKKFFDYVDKYEGGGA